MLQLRSIKNIPLVNSRLHIPTSRGRSWISDDFSSFRGGRGDFLMLLGGTEEISAVIEAANQFDKKQQSWCIYLWRNKMKYESWIWSNIVWLIAGIRLSPPKRFRKCVASMNIDDILVAFDLSWTPIEWKRQVTIQSADRKSSGRAKSALNSVEDEKVSEHTCPSMGNLFALSFTDLCSYLSQSLSVRSFVFVRIPRTNTFRTATKTISVDVPLVRKFSSIESLDTEVIDNRQSWPWPSSWVFVSSSLLYPDEYIVFWSIEFFSAGNWWKFGRTPSELPVYLLLNETLTVRSYFSQVYLLPSLFRSSRCS